MTIESSLTKLVDSYVIFDEQQGCYQGVITPQQLVALEEEFALLLNGHLVSSGTKKEQITARYNQLKNIFEVQNLSPALLWLENALSKGINSGACLQKLEKCYQRLVPQSGNQIISKFNGMKTRQGLQKLLMNARDGAQSTQQRDLFVTLLNSLDEINGYYDDVGKVKKKSLRILLKFMPVVLTGLGTMVVAEELFAAYAFYFILLKSGQLISKSDADNLSAVGNSLQKVSIISFNTTSKMLARCVEMVFWGSRQGYLATVQSASALLEPFTHEKQKNDENIAEELTKLLPKLKEGLQFKNPQLKLIAMPIEEKSGSLEGQHFLSLRTGKHKLQVLDKLLKNMQECDQSSETIEEKFIAFEHWITVIKNNKHVFYNTTAEVINKAEQFLIYLRENPDFLQNTQIQEVYSEETNNNNNSSNEGYSIETTDPNFDPKSYYGLFVSPQ